MSIASAFSRAVLPRKVNSNRGKVASRSARLVVEAKVNLQGGPRVIRGKCFVTRDVSWHMPGCIDFSFTAFLMIHCRVQQHSMHH